MNVNEIIRSLHNSPDAWISKSGWISSNYGKFESYISVHRSGELIYDDGLQISPGFINFLRLKFAIWKWERLSIKNNKK